MKYKFALCFCLACALFCKANAQVKKAAYPIAVKDTSKPLRDEKDTTTVKNLVRIKVSPGSKFIIHNVQIKPGTYTISIQNDRSGSEPKLVKKN